ncbi:aminotransferase-like domain-containing protein, partial [Serratia marcescens]
MTRYEQLAQQIREQIQNRVWRAGDKLPSLRESGKRAGLSLMTVVQSYQLLESQGWIVARPQSGYYVAARPQPLPQPSRGEKLLLSEQVDINAFIFDVLQACKDPDIVPFGSAFPDATLFAQPKLARALSSVARKFTPHSSLANLPPGNDALRRHIAQRYALSGMQVAPDEIVITAGAMESLSLSLQAVTQPGDYVAIESPAFYGALQALERLRLKAVAIATHPQDGIDLDALQQAVEQYPIKACWLMTHFQNPQGATLPEANKQRLVTLLRERQISLIEDDVYGELYFSAERPLPAKALDSGGQI